MIVVGRVSEPAGDDRQTDALPGAFFRSGGAWAGEGETPSGLEAGEWASPSRSPAPQSATGSSARDGLVSEAGVEGKRPRRFSPVLGYSLSWGWGRGLG